MPTRTRGDDGPEGGFTLLEVLAALAIMALALTVVGIRPGRDPSAEPAKLALEAAAIARDVRRDAIEAGQDQVLVVDIAGRTIGGRNRTMTLPGGVTIVLTTSAAERASATLGGIRFFPDGSSTGGQIAFSSHGKAQTIVIDWFTGRVAVSEGGR